ncbi:MAG: adenylosuccinate synthase [Ardenticatenaceae bacterium]|nr:adenylosuccinate synthase [Ardenticatenaceae bacterium]MCB9445561.1 adenylosuccinate synthase [Ardenticatenaceae bacterium]
MSFNIIVGAQWGDEGKGRYTDLMAAEADLVGRYSGGDNAGHTVTVSGEIFKLHLIPSGIVHSKPICLIGGGVVLNPAVLLREMAALAERGVDVGPHRLKISKKAHLITPAHIALDKALETQKGKGAIGTTLRGIGPAYTDKASRIGLRAGLFSDLEATAVAIKKHIATKNKLLSKVYGMELLDVVEIVDQYIGYAKLLQAHLVDDMVLVHDYLKNGRSVLAEGAQGTFLDIDHGTYPFVTSSHPTAPGALTGLGVGPKMVDRVIGVAKAFTSRVGNGPFPCELSGSEAARLRGTGDNPWDEFGTTTGRPRRVGWLDLVMLRHAHRLNSLTELAITKLDVLSGLEEVPVCVSYELDESRIDYVPSDLDALGRCTAVYETLPGWQEDVTGIRRFEDLPVNAQSYINFIAEQVNVPIKYISVGPARDQVITIET